MPSRGQALDLPGAVLATAVIILVTYGLVVTDIRPRSSAGVLVPLRCRAMLLTAFWYAERRAGDPMLSPGFLCDQRRTLARAAITLSACGPR